MRLGLIARADNTGLGMQTWDFYRHMQPDKTMVVDISKYNKNPQFPMRYPDRATFVQGFPQPPEIDTFLKDLDCVFVAEAPYNYYLYERARELGVKTAVQYNYEFFDWFAYPHYPKPDMLIAPSKWHYDEVEAFCQQNDIQHVYLHCPVDRHRFQFREISQAKTFLHTGGKPAAYDRNGTLDIIAASKYIKSDIQILIHFQGEQGLLHQATHTTDFYKQQLAMYGDPSKVTIDCTDYTDNREVYHKGDVLLLPRRYGGNCLPMNEALSMGMPVIMTDVQPNNLFLPNSWLTMAEARGEFTPRTRIQIYGTFSQDLAELIDNFASLDADNMMLQNSVANALANQISWESLKPIYQKALEELCNL